MRTLLSLLVLAMVGCGGVSAPTNPNPVDFSGKATLAGKPLNDMKVTLQPTKVGHPTTCEVTNGEFKGSAIPGTYVYYISDGKDKAAFEAVPAQHREPKEDRTVNVSSGATLNLDFN